MAALCPEIPLTPPPRIAPAPQRKILGWMVSTPHDSAVPSSRNGNERSLWKIFPRGSDMDFSRSRGDLVSVHNVPSELRARHSSIGSSRYLLSCLKSREVTSLFAPSLSS